MCGEDGLPALSVYLAGSPLWSTAGGAEASSESHGHKPHKEIKDVIGRGRRKHCCSSSCACSSAGPASRIACTGPEGPLEVSEYFPKAKAPANPKHGKIPKETKSSTTEKLCRDIAVAPQSDVFPAVCLYGRSTRHRT